MPFINDKEWEKYTKKLEELDREIKRLSDNAKNVRQPTIDGFAGKRLILNDNLNVIELLEKVSKYHDKLHTLDSASDHSGSSIEQNYLMKADANGMLVQSLINEDGTKTYIGSAITQIPTYLEVNNVRCYGGSSYLLFESNVNMSTIRFYLKVINQATEPAAGIGSGQIDAGELAMWTDTDDAKCYLCYNHGGTVKTVELT